MALITFAVWRCKIKLRGKKQEYLDLISFCHFEMNFLLAFEIENQNYKKEIYQSFSCFLFLNNFEPLSVLYFISKSAS